MSVRERLVALPPRGAAVQRRSVGAMVGLSLEPLNLRHGLLVLSPPSPRGKDKEVFHLDFAAFLNDYNAICSTHSGIRQTKKVLALLDFLLSFRSLMIEVITSNKQQDTTCLQPVEESLRHGKAEVQSDPSRRTKPHQGRRTSRRGKHHEESKINYSNQTLVLHLKPNESAKPQPHEPHMQATVPQDGRGPPRSREELEREKNDCRPRCLVWSQKSYRTIGVVEALVRSRGSVR